MFRKIDEIGNITQTNRTTVKHIRNSFAEMFPLLKDNLDEIVSKKAILYTTKIKPENKYEIIFTENEIICAVDGKFVIPHLKILHRYQDWVPRMQVDKGAIKHVMTGANIMCPGLTSKGGKMEEIETEKMVLITAEGKINGMGVGKTKLSTSQIREVNKGVAIEMLHYLNDGLWNFKIPKVPKGSEKD